jgi:putative transposase
MPRTGRQKSKTGIYHIILRGINRQTIFEDEEDSKKFLQLLLKYKNEGRYKIYGYCLMGNHIHLLIKGEEDLGIVMRRIGASYVYWYNFKYDRTGHLFQDRFKSEVVEDDRYLLTVIRYIHQNPLKAGLVSDLSKSKWNSYNEYVGKSRLVDTDFVLSIFNKDRVKALASFREFHQIINDDDCLDASDSSRLKDDEAIEIIRRVCGIASCKDLQKIAGEERDKQLRTLKEQGLSTRQISRLTGLTRHVVLKA